MKAIILAAGQGKRLRPLTDTRPKCLVELAGRTLLDRQIEVLKRCGIKDIVIIGGWCADQLKDKGTRFYTNPDFDNSNMVETLFCAAKEFDGTDDMLICYSDIVYEPTIINAILQAADDISTTVDKHWQALWDFRMENALSDAETMKLDSKGFIIELGKKPKSLSDIEGQYMGITRVSKQAQPRFLEAYCNLPAVLDTGKARKDIFMTDFLQHIIDNVNPIKAVLVTGGWLEVDTLEDITRYEAAIRDGSLTKILGLHA